MKSFVFWLVVAAAVGALAASIVPMGPIEIGIVAIVVLLLSYGWPSHLKPRRVEKTAE